jgi:hypothetical protein
MNCQGRNRMLLAAVVIEDAGAVDTDGQRAKYDAP